MNDRGVFTLAKDSKTRNNALESVFFLSFLLFFGDSQKERHSQPPLLLVLLLFSGEKKKKQSGHARARHGERGPQRASREDPRQGGGEGRAPVPSSRAPLQGSTAFVVAVVDVAVVAPVGVFVFAAVAALRRRVVVARSQDPPSARRRRGDFAGLVAARRGSRSSSSR